MLLFVSFFYRPLGADEKPAAPERKGQKSAPLPIPWTLDVEHRFVWLKGGEKVGETRFSIERVQHEGDRPAYVVKAHREYDHEGTSQRSSGTTVVSLERLPLDFRETLRMSTLGGVRGQQETRIEFRSKKAVISSIHNRVESRPVKREIEMAGKTYLYGSQAVEHWVLFTSAFPRSFEKHEVKLLYPDFDKVLEVTFESKAKERLVIGKRPIESRRCIFSTSDKQLNGIIWLDEDGRLVQIEFPAASLRVVLTEEEGG